MKEIICKVMGISNASYYRWKQDRPVIGLLEKYCTQEDLEEFLETGKIKKFENSPGDDEEMEEFFLKNALMKIEMYGTRENPPLLRSIKQAFNLAAIPACLPVNTFLDILKSKSVKDPASFEAAIELTEPPFENWKNIMRDFVDNKLSKKEMKMLIKNKKYVVEYVSALPHLNHG